MGEKLKLNMNLQQMTEQILPYCKQQGVSKLGIFGSFARGTARPDSDLDLLVDFVHPTSLLTQIRIERELSELLGIKIDLVTEQGLSPYLRDQIKAELKVIL
ncbi:nucleotidyltransferase family protein [Trichlorobacter sp.]|uniref:nucleotidyltransferase family protein n=1 Tax=Trichlorobacter sp. TaxID=2911007 RepID=UPI002A35A003|nr:nucleotidyltransferase family protein [Trichlorobacter sp.]MDY0384040.1 nucleotidyltransferase family protein [Trichlorobacter sp.]